MDMTCGLATLTIQYSTYNTVQYSTAQHSTYVQYVFNTVSCSKDLQRLQHRSQAPSMRTWRFLPPSVFDTWHTSVQRTVQYVQYVWF